MNDKSGFYKNDNGVIIFAPNYIMENGVVLHRDEKETYTFPIDGWIWSENGDVETILNALSSVWLEPSWNYRVTIVNKKAIQIAFDYTAWLETLKSQPINPKIIDNEKCVIYMGYINDDGTINPIPDDVRALLKGYGATIEEKPV